MNRAYVPIDADRNDVLLNAGGAGGSWSTRRILPVELVTPECTQPWSPLTSYRPARKIVVVRARRHPRRIFDAGRCGVAAIKADTPGSRKRTPHGKPEYITVSASKNSKPAGLEPIVRKAEIIVIFPVLQ